MSRSNIESTISVAAYVDNSLFTTATASAVWTTAAGGPRCRFFRSPTASPVGLRHNGEVV